MANTMKISLYSPERPIAEVEADHLLVPGVLGYMGIKPDHTALISELGVGELRIDGAKSAGDFRYFVSGGYVEVLDNSVKVLVDVAEHIDEIDLSRAGESEMRAQKRLDDKSDIKVDIARALGALERAKARKKLAEGARR
ncbi:MAG: ATP synthase F1 subunit epsilon [Bdellovibrionota bacterium]